MNKKELKLLALNELRKANVDIPEEKYDQDSYDTRQDERCGCLMYHYDKDEDGWTETWNPENFSEKYEGVLSYSQLKYLTGHKEDITMIAKKNNWPLFNEKFNKEEAIKRIDFIIKHVEYET